MIFNELLKSIHNFFSGAKGTKVLYFSLCLVLALLLANASASLTWKALDSLTPFTEIFTLQNQAEGTRAAGKSKVSAAKAVLPASELSLFGQADKIKASAGKASESKDVPVTTLGLILKGIITAEPMSRALAIIAEKGGKNKEELYGVGDKVPGNAVISEIFADRIILRRGGVLETLFLDTGESKGASIKSRKSRSTGSGKIVNLGDGIHWKIDNEYLSKRLGDLPGLAREIGVEVYKENNVQKGYRLVSARGSKLLREMGLKPGDVLLEVNGRKLNTIQAGLAVYKDINSAQEMRVVFIRNGRNETRIYEIGSDS